MEDWQRKVGSVEPGWEADAPLDAPTAHVPVNVTEMERAGSRGRWREREREGGREGAGEEEEGGRAS